MNNAGTTRHGSLDAASSDDWDVTTNVNLRAPFFVTQAVANAMKRHRYGRIIKAELKEIAARIPLARLAEPSDISKAVLFLASKLNTYITGQSLLVDGGYSIV